ncbi:umta methyltransferase family protein [Colletotrichum karsti]|uniref:Umta methyltransferase family protein n=1 Tax=Colletotrichum karsti TaxID=1095194 RepID=A0A9P6I315_9PEZI|nr:umta methyltransferase family protein [Colletotrichum karsti]KAF9874910.1 umta methyltransferase family protein [Colletotrichum karsti]
MKDTQSHHPPDDADITASDAQLTSGVSEMDVDPRSSPPRPPVAVNSHVTVEPDNDFGNDLDSIDEQMSQYSKSLTSSIVNYPVEYGRRYHAFRAGSYKFPNDEREMERLDLAHAMMVLAMGNKLYCSPLQPERIQRVLDIGTGTGIWAIEMGDKFDHAEINGIDLSNIQPDWIPPNVKFTIDDIESPWVDNKKYDFIMCRYMGASIQNWPGLMQNIYDHLSPGGWAEFQDVNTTFYSEDGSYTPEHATYKWMNTFVGACESTGRDPSVGPKLEGWVRSAGFDNVVAQGSKVPLGIWPKHPYYKQLGWMNLKLTLDGLEALSLKLFSEMLNWTEEKITEELEKVRAELQSGVFHALFDVHMVYGQKPLNK